MANRKTTIEMIAARFHIPFNTLDVFDKSLVKAGVRPYAVRGKDAPQLTGLDVAHIALAASGPRSVKSVAKDIAQISALPLRGGIRELRDFDLSTYDYVYSQDGAKLTPTGIIEGALLQSYPRDILPMAETFGSSLANIIERMPLSDEVEKLVVEAVWPPLSAKVQFRIDKFQYRIDFGEATRGDLDEPEYSFKYRQGVLGYLGEIYRS